MCNYEVLANIYKSRKGHKLDEWRELCDWIEELPYSELITGKCEEDLVFKIPKNHISPEALEMIEKGLTTDMSIGFKVLRNEKQMKNKEQAWIDRHPVIWWFVEKLKDFAWFNLKFSICMLIYIWFMTRW